MATSMSLRGRQRSPESAALLAERLLERTVRELELPDRPLARLAADRCVRRLLDACEAIAAAGAGSGGRRGEGSPDPHLRLLLVEARRGVRAARWSLGLVHRQGAMLPSAYRQIVAGLEVLSRRLDRLGIERSDD